MTLVPFDEPQAGAFIYSTDELQSELRQPEIISDLIQFAYDSATGEVESTEHRYSIVLSQDCDLKWDFEKRIRNEPGEMNGVLLCEIELWSVVRATIGGRDIWKPISQNKNERYQYLEAIPPRLDLEGEGIVALVVDFKKAFTISSDEFYRQIENRCKRRCRLLSPYVEHLQNRFASYIYRVGLPEPHALPPV